jgi:hypothetical protein
VDGELSFLIPSSAKGQSITVGQRFILTDNVDAPQTYEVTKIKDTVPLGVTRCYLKQKLFNPHKDYVGVINDHKDAPFVFELPIEDLPEGFGGPWHMICDCLEESFDEFEQPDFPVLACDRETIRALGTEVSVSCSITVPETAWQFTLDGEQIKPVELEGQMSFVFGENYVTMRVLSRDLIKYVLGVSLKTSTYETEEMELEVIA